MGCGGSKKGKKEKCDMTMELTGNADIDNLFANAAAPLATLAEVNNNLKKARNRLQRRTHAYLLNDCTLEDAIMAMLYGLSASTNGDFDKIDLKIDDDSPYVKMSKHKVEHHMHEVVEAWNYFAEKLVDSVKILADLPEQIKALVEECEGLQDKAKEVCTNSGMGLLDSAKAIKVIANNVLKISKAPTVLSETKKEFEDLIHCCKHLNAKCDNEGRVKIHEIGKAIHAAKVVVMRDIVVNYWPVKTRVNLKFERPRKVKPAGHHK